jgi:hypothetical protein
MNESFVLTSAQIGLLFEGIIVEAELWNQFKSGIGQAAGAVADKAKQVGKNITTKVTADKLQAAWKAAGSPTDSVEIGKILSKAGVDIEVVKSAMQSIGVEPTVPDDAQATQPPAVELPDVSGLTVAQKQQLLAQLDALDTQPAATPTQAPEQPSMSQLLKQRQAQGLGAYESVDFTNLKTKLKEALAK